MFCTRQQEATWKDCKYGITANTEKIKCLVFRDIIHWFKRWNTLCSKKRCFTNFLRYADRIFFIWHGKVWGLFHMRKWGAIVKINDHMIVVSRQMLKKMVATGDNSLIQTVECCLFKDKFSRNCIKFYEIGINFCLSRRKCFHPLMCEVIKKACALQILHFSSIWKLKCRE